MTNFDKANKIEEAIREAITSILTSKQDVEDAKAYFDGMSINDYITEEEAFIGDSV